LGALRTLKKQVFVRRRVATGDNVDSDEAQRLGHFGPATLAAKAKVPSDFKFVTLLTGYSPHDLSLVHTRLRFNLGRDNNIHGGPGRDWISATDPGLLPTEPPNAPIKPAPIFRVPRPDAPRFILDEQISGIRNRMPTVGGNQSGRDYINLGRAGWPSNPVSITVGSKTFPVGLEPNGNQNPQGQFVARNLDLPQGEVINAIVKLEDGTEVPVQFPATTTF
jgi:hypothetical protein